ncbi:MAG: flagellar motor switch protein FliN [Planctomycetes bacterium]|nr:flagellar motor switch protein FliN [Planctomycetota bacterium]
MPEDQDEIQAGGGALGQDELDKVVQEAQNPEAGQEETSEDASDELVTRGEVEEAEKEDAEGRETASGDEEAKPVELPELETPPAGQVAGGIDLLMDVGLDVKIELGGAQMAIEDILKLRKGSVVELDKLAGDPVDILVNDRPVAKGEILVVNDNFCVRVTEITDPQAGLKPKSDSDE